MGIGPVEYMVVAFPGNQFKGEIAPALGDLVDNGTIRVLDLAFIMKDAEGNVVGAELEDAGSEVINAFEALTFERGGLISDNDIIEIGEALEPESSAAILVWEDLWAGPLRGRRAQCRRRARRHPAHPARDRPGSHRLRRRAGRKGVALMRMRRRGPGLVGMAVGTAVVAGTAGAVRHHQEQKYAGQAAEAQAVQQQAYDAGAADAQAAYAPPPALRPRPRST